MLTLSAQKAKGFQPITLNRLASVPVTPRGTRSDRWQGIQHAELAKSLKSTFKDLFGTVAMNEQYFISPSGATVIGGFELGNEETKRGKTKIVPVEPLPGTAASVGFIHANDSSKSLHILAGGRVFLCSNGVVVGEVQLRHKHTSGLYLSDWLKDGLGEFLPTLSASLQKQVAPLREASISPSQHDAGLLALGRQNVIPWKMLPDFDRAWLDAAGGKSISWVAEDDQDKWEFTGSKFDWFGAVSHIAKALPPSEQIVSLSRSLTLVTAL
jgi:hypothetical protein